MNPIIKSNTRLILAAVGLVLSIAFLWEAIHGGRLGFYAWAFIYLCIAIHFFRQQKEVERERKHDSQ